MTRAPFMLTAGEHSWLRRAVREFRERLYDSGDFDSERELDSAMAKVYNELVVKPGAEQFAEDQLTLPLS